jgi:small subunit ribosomal protein S29
LSSFTGKGSKDKNAGLDALIQGFRRPLGEATTTAAVVEPPLPLLTDPPPDDSLATRSDDAAAARRAEVRAELVHKQGRGWSDPWDLAATYASTDGMEALPDWSAALVSRVSRERVQIYNGATDTTSAAADDTPKAAAAPPCIPTLTQLATLPLPPPPHVHPGHGGTTKAYALARQRHIISYVAAQVAELAAPRVAAIQTLQSWEDKQDAVDALFEGIEFTLQQKEVILGKHPKFGLWVERSLEAYLKSIQKKEAVGDDAGKAVDDATEQATPVEAAAIASPDETTIDMETAMDTTFSTVGPQLPTTEQDAAALPLFVDCFGSSDDPEANIPHILSPLGPLVRGTNQGRMMEEWELAAHKTTKRILLRQATRAAAHFCATHPVARVLVTGRQGTGKTAALLTLVAAARQEGHVVLFLPHCDRLAEHGFYIEPNEHRPGMYDLPVLSQQICGELLASHQAAVANLSVSQECLDEFFAPDQQKKVGAAAGSSDTTALSVADLLTVGSDKRGLSPMCFAAAVDTLMKQDEVPFTMVLDEFNTFYQPGKYFHEHYDTNVRKAIPYQQISLFAQALGAMGLVAADQEALPEPVLMKRGAVICAMTHSKPVADVTNTALVASAQEAAAASTATMAHAPLLVTDVPRLSNLEVDHIVANYEAIGLGKLRLDQGETVTNAQEVAYLRTLSSNVPQELMNACLM